MGYFDNLSSGSFKITEDGGCYFYPWGAKGQGYEVSSEEDFERLRRGLKRFLIVATLFSGTAPLWVRLLSISWLTALGLLIGLWVVSYAFWVMIQCRRRPRTDQKLSHQDARDELLRGSSSTGLWYATVLTFALALTCVAVFVADPSRAWLGSLLGIAFFGGLSALMAKAIVAKRRLERGENTGS